jgi:hypothetical protein
VGSLNPVFPAGQETFGCASGIQAIEIPCLALCTGTALETESPGATAETAEGDCCEPDAASPLDAPAAPTCFCCTGSPGTKKGPGTRLSDIRPAAFPSLSQALDRLTPVVPKLSGKTPLVAAAGLSHHLPSRATVVIIV